MSYEIVPELQRKIFFCENKVLSSFFKYIMSFVVGASSLTAVGSLATKGENNFNLALPTMPKYTRHQFPALNWHIVINYFGVS